MQVPASIYGFFPYKYNVPISFHHRHVFHENP